MNRDNPKYYLIPLIILGIIGFSTWTLFGQPEQGPELQERWLAMQVVFGVSLLVTIVAFAAQWVNKTFNKIEPIQFSGRVDYDGAVIRVKPVFDSENAFQSLLLGGVSGILAVGYGNLILNVVVGTVRGTATIGFDEVCFGFFFVPAVLFLGWLGYSSFRKGVVALWRRRAWFDGAKTAEALIVDRQVEEVVERSKKSLRFELILKVGGRLFRAVVSERIFRRYMQRDSVNVFYAIVSPKVLIVQGE